jgi:hypothetical protein
MKVVVPFIILLSFFSSCTESIQKEQSESTKRSPVDSIVSIDSNNKSSSCLDIMEEILTTSPEFKTRTKGLHERIVSNGGITFEIEPEGSPNAQDSSHGGFSSTYDFYLYEYYPDRRTIDARYTFDPARKQLYEVDLAKETLKPIEFDRNLLAEFERRCK